MRVSAGIVLVPLVVVIPFIPAGGVTVQLNVAPVIVLLSVTGNEVSPEQMDCGAEENNTVGAGFTVMVNVSVDPAHPLAVATTDSVATIGELVVFVGVKAGISPLPVAPRPIPVFELDQAKVVPITALLKRIGVVIAPLQYI